MHKHGHFGAGPRAFWMMGRRGDHGFGPFGHGFRGGRGGRGRDGFRSGRMLGDGDLRLIALLLIEEQPRHGYDIIRATPYKAEGGQYQTCGVVSKEIDGVVKEHRFIRADRFAALDDAVDISITKGQQLVDEQGERLFG